ncbi:MAG: hypothetical protein PF444_08445 [Bacteroidales bacterium]|jgi:hypothetical protein|nr:hypothetical protein [Bacteroidales bacterium]
MKSLFSIIFIALLAISNPIKAQSQLSPVDSLGEHLYKSSNRYTESGTTYRVVKWEVLKAYFKDIKGLDTEKSAQIEASAKQVQGLELEKKTQQASYEKLNAKYERAVKVNDAMEIFSLLIPKAQYNLIMWSLVGILIGSIIIVYLMFNRGRQAARLAKKELGEKMEEFDSYRKRTLKREQEVATGYLRDIKKLKEQLGSI